ncbi:hypothetical protein Tco_0426383 [Tanacetum coccineum]
MLVPQPVSYTQELLLGKENNSIVKIPEELVEPTCFLFFCNSARYTGQFLFQCPTSLQWWQASSLAGRFLAVDLGLLGLGIDSPKPTP